MGGNELWNFKAHGHFDNLTFSTLKVKQTIGFLYCKNGQVSAHFSIEICCTFMEKVITIFVLKEHVGEI